jgi:hypothetical protein
MRGERRGESGQQREQKGEEHRGNNESRKERKIELTTRAERRRK